MLRGKQINPRMVADARLTRDVSQSHRRALRAQIASERPTRSCRCKWSARVLPACPEWRNRSNATAMNSAAAHRMRARCPRSQLEATSFESAGIPHVRFTCDRGRCRPLPSNSGRALHQVRPKSAPHLPASRLALGQRLRLYALNATNLGRWVNEQLGIFVFDQ